MLGEGSRPPSVSGDIQLCTLPAGPRAVIPAVWACSDGGSPFHRIPGNVTALRIILLTGSVSFLGPCRGSRPVGFPNPSARWRRDLPQLDLVLPSVALPLLAMYRKITGISFCCSYTIRLLKCINRLKYTTSLQ